MCASVSLGRALGQARDLLEGLEGGEVRTGDALQERLGVERGRGGCPCCSGAYCGHTPWHYP